MPVGSVLVVVMLSPVEIVMLSACVVTCAVGIVLSVTLTVNGKVPALVGLPEITPALLRLSPPGRVPLVTIHVYGVWPFCADSVAE
jgi:hypothetical protein